MINIVDKAGLYFFHHLIRCYPLDIVAPYISWFGNFFTVLFIFLVLFVIGKGVTKQYALLGAVVAAGASFISDVLKDIFKRPRPYFTEYADTIIGLSKSFSFPSGHATIMFAVAYILSHRYKKLRKVFFGIATLVALSRIYMGLHYPSDVIAGAFLGYGCAFVGVKFAEGKLKLLNK
jgi:undecaprenyl-diphosphatase